MFAPQPGLRALPTRTAGRGLGSLALLTAFWLILINQLRLDWSTNPQYSYGWLVPVLAAYLFWIRWPSRPEPEPLTHRAWLGAAVALLALAYLPTRFIREASPEWSVVSWALALEVVGLSLAALAYAGGWATLRHFAWPVCFFLVAVAWPARFEGALTQDLMQRLASITAEVLSWAGVAAQAQGNLVQLANGTIGVDEACSGVRSLQSMLMASLFLGELHCFPRLGRLGLVLAGFVLAVFFNIVRALILVTIAVRHGVPAVSEWHDPAGFSILLVSFGLLCLLIRLCAPRRPPCAALAPQRPWRPLSRRLVVTLGLWLFFTEAVTQAWYLSHETRGLAAPGWSVRWPEAHPAFQERPIPPNVAKTLAYSEGRYGVWEENDGSHWQMFSFKWNAGRTSTIAARMHRPEVCLPASGRTLVQEAAPEVIAAEGLEVPFRVYQFDQHGEPLYVFFCLWEVGSRDLPGQGLRQNYSRESRLQRARIGQRNLGQQSVEVVVTGLPDLAHATAEFHRLAEGMLVPAKK